MVYIKVLEALICLPKEA